MTKLTTERLEEMRDHYLGMVNKDVGNALTRLIAYEQAAKEVACWGVTGQRGQIYPLPPQTARMDSFPLYRAPVLPKQPEPENKIAQIKRQKALAWLKRVAYENPCMKEVKTCIEVLSAPAQPVIPGQLTQRMAEEKALSLGAVLYDEEADVFADGWNACRAEMLKAQPVSEPYKLPDGWAMVPEEATIAMLTLLGLTGSFDFMQQKYKNMLAAAPTAQESE